MKMGRRRMMARRRECRTEPGSGRSSSSVASLQNQNCKVNHLRAKNFKDKESFDHITGVSEGSSERRLRRTTRSGECVQATGEVDGEICPHARGCRDEDAVSEGWCPRPDSNRHGDYPPPPQDGVSTSSTTWARRTAQPFSGVSVPCGSGVAGWPAGPSPSSCSAPPVWP